MKIMLSETVTHFHEVELSDELDVESILNKINDIKPMCNSGLEAIETILKAYKDNFGEAFNYSIKNAGSQVDSIDYDYTIED